jgi:sugar transferase (PEP-CTERM/EpsH1 system associated)
VNILFVVPYVPSLVRTRSYNLIRHLSARGHRVTTLTIWSNDRERGEAEELKKHCHDVHAVRLPAWRSLRNCVSALAGSDPLQAAYSWSSEVLARMAALQPHADVVHVEHLRGARYAIAANEHASGVPVVWDSVDCISYLFAQSVTRRRDRIGRVINHLELLRTRRYEGWMCRQLDHVLITSDADKKAITALAQDQHAAQSITVLPNGVDTGYFTPTDERRQPHTLVFSGKMSYHANVAAAAYLIGEIMPRVWTRLPDVQLQIVGKDPARSLRTLAARYPSRVTVTGTVSDLRPFLRQATAAVIPLVYGAGSQFKVLEAMACATPVVASPKAVSALHAQPGRDVLVGDGPEAFAKAVIELLADPQKQREMGEAGRRYVDAHHRWDAIAARLEAVYEDAIAARHAQESPRLMTA